MNPLKAFIHSNIYISLAAVFLTVETQIQLGMEPQAHPYLFIIFFATLFEYNLRVFYSVPVYRNKKRLFRLREIPYLKIFLIASVWSASTILLPVIQANEKFDNVQIIMLLLERFFFIFAITIPFDIRDMEVDQSAGLKTIPLLLNENNALKIALLSLFIFFLISFFHYQSQNKWFIIWALGISTFSTFLFLKLKYFRNLSDYHYGVLDGTILLQGLLVLAFHYIHH